MPRNASNRALLRAVETEDADGDGASNLEELERGPLPADASSVPVDTGGCAQGENPQYDVCRYDARSAYRRVLLDFCGQSPTYAQRQSFSALGVDTSGSGLPDASAFV
ncbi:hypothetical protein ACLESO_01320 [Pyxidicoccus sp. 3LG]